MRLEHREAKVSIGLILVWILEFISNVWYTKKYFILMNLNSDYAGDAVLAKHLADTGKLVFSDDWYPTTEVYVIHHQLIMTPLFRIMGDYSRTWVGTTIIAFVLMSLAVYFFSYSLSKSTTRSLLAVTLFMNPIATFQMTFSVWFHGYLFYYVLAFIVLGMLFKFYTCQDNFNLKDYIPLSLVSIMSGLCGIRMFMIIYIPLLVAYFIAMYNTELSKIWTPFSKLVVTSLVGSFAGFLAYYIFILPKYGNGSLVGLGITLYDAEMIKDNILTIPQTLIDGLSINFSKTSSYFYAAMVGILILLWLIILINSLGVLFNSGFDRKLRFSVLFSLSCMAVNLAFMIITQPNDELISRYRYFAISTFAMMPIFAASLKLDGIKKVKDLFNVSVIAMSFVAIGFFAANAINEYGDNPKSWREPYLEFLTQNGYTFGYATYWNADVSIMMANGKIQFVPVNNDEKYSMFKWNTRRSYEEIEPEFVLLTNDEYEERMDKDSIDNKMIYSDENVIIFKYN